MPYNLKVQCILCKKLIDSDLNTLKDEFGIVSIGNREYPNCICKTCVQDILKSDKDNQTGKIICKNEQCDNEVTGTISYGKNEEVPNCVCETCMQHLLSKNKDTQTIKARCPKCGIEANGLDEIKSLFGFRNTSPTTTIPQSRCYECRSKSWK